MTHYVLGDDGRTPVATDLMTWGRTYEDAQRAQRAAGVRPIAPQPGAGWALVARTELSGSVSVSTVFLGLDHRFGSDGPPIVFETIVFGGDFDGDQARYSTWAEALAGHEAMVERVRAGATVEP